MPNQNNSNQVNDNIQSPSMPVHTDIPPMPDFSNLNNANTTSISTPASNFFPPNNNIPPKKKFGSKKIIATFLGILLLVGGVTAGIALILQPQFLNQQAASVGYVGCSTNANCSATTVCIDHQCVTGTTGGSCAGTFECHPTEVCVSGQCNDHDVNNCGTVNHACDAGFSCIAGVCIVNSDTSCKIGDMGAPVCCTDEDLISCNERYVCEGGTRRLECIGRNGKYCTVAVNSPDCGPGSTTPPSTPKPPTPRPTPTRTPTPTPSPTPLVYACTGIGRNIGAPKLGDNVSFTCSSTFRTGSPVAYFRWSTGVEAWKEDTTASTVNISTGIATRYQLLNINIAGHWEVQCRVCTNTTKTNCTTWGQAN